MGKFDLSKVGKEEEYKKVVEEVSEKFKEYKELDEENPLERARKFDAVKRTLIEPGYMQVDVYEGEDEDGDKYLISESKSGSKKKILIHDGMFKTDLNTSITADIAAVPMNIMPMIVDQAQQLVANEKKEFKTKKRKEEFNWWWVVLGLLMIPGIILGILIMLGG